MRVLAVNDYATGGGAERVVTQTAALLQKRGLNVKLVTARSLGLCRTPWGYVHNAKAARRIRRVITEFRPHVVHVHNFYHELSPSILGGIPKGVPVVITLHDYHLACPNVGLEYFTSQGRQQLTVDELPLPVRIKMRRRWDERGWAWSGLRAAQHVLAYDVRRLQDRVTTFIALSETSASLLRPMVPDVQILPNPTLGARSDAPPEARRTSGRLRMIVVGRIEPEKGLPRFIDMLARIDGLPQRWQLDVVGDGRDIPASKYAQSRTRLETTFHGRLAHGDTLRLMRRAHVLALPSLWYETDPLVLVEALEQGCWLLTSDRGGSKDTVRLSTAGITYDPDDTASLARGLAWLEARAVEPPDATTVKRYLSTRDPGRWAAQQIRLYEQHAR